VEEIAVGKLVIQRSKFYAHVYKLAPGDGDEEIKLVLKEHRRKYKKANHHCWAACFGGGEEWKDDGEVGHPGKVMLEVLKKEGLDSHLLVVSRIFGGVKLGVGGVSRAFRSAAEGVVDQVVDETKE